MYTLRNRQLSPASSPLTAGAGSWWASRGHRSPFRHAGHRRKGPGPQRPPRKGQDRDKITGGHLRATPTAPAPPGCPLPRVSQPLRTYPELRQVELRRIVAQHGHQGGRPRLTKQAPAEGGSWRVHSLAVPGDVAGRQVDQHVVHVQRWPEHCLRRGSAHLGAGNWTTNPSTCPLWLPPSLLSDPPTMGPNAHLKAGTTRPSWWQLGSPGGEQGRSVKPGPRFSFRLPHCQAPWAAATPSLDSVSPDRGP